MIITVPLSRYLLSLLVITLSFTGCVQNTPKVHVNEPEPQAVQNTIKVHLSDEEAKQKIEQAYQLWLNNKTKNHEYVKHSEWVARFKKFVYGRAAQPANFIDDICKEGLPDKILPLCTLGNISRDGNLDAFCVFQPDVCGEGTYLMTYGTTLLIVSDESGNYKVIEDPGAGDYGVDDLLEITSDGILKFVARDRTEADAHCCPSKTSFVSYIFYKDKLISTKVIKKKLSTEQAKARINEVYQKWRAFKIDSKAYMSQTEWLGWYDKIQSAPKLKSKLRSNGEWIMGISDSLSVEAYGNIDDDGNLDAICKLQLYDITKGSNSKVDAGEIMILSDKYGEYSVYENPLGYQDGVLEEIMPNGILKYTIKDFSGSNTGIKHELFKFKGDHLEEVN